MWRREKYITIELTVSLFWLQGLEGKQGKLHLILNLQKNYFYIALKVYIYAIQYAPVYILFMCKNLYTLLKAVLV